MPAIESENGPSEDVNDMPSLEETDDDSDTE